MRIATQVLATIMAIVLLATTATAQSTPPVRIRGTIAALAGGALTVNERSGQTENVMLDDPLTVMTVKPVPLEQITRGSYIGVAARSAADGMLVALEVTVFPEEMRGAGEGHQSWDLEAGSTMTNASVTGVVQMTGGSDLTLTYKDGSKLVRIPPTAPIVLLAPADRGDLKVGAPVFLVARPKDGSLHAGRVTVGTNGVAPPM